MRLSKGVPQTMPLILAAALLLCGCSAGGQTAAAERLRKNYVNLTSYETTAEIAADYGTYVYQFAAEITGDAEGGRLTIRQPDNIAGIVFSWSAGSGRAELEEVTLETGDLSPDGLSPADAMPVILDSLARGSMVSACEETLEGETVQSLELTNPSLPGDSEMISVWLSAEDGSLRRAEIAWGGTTVITCVFSDFHYTYQETEG